MPLNVRPDSERRFELAEELFGTSDRAEAAAAREARVEAEGGAYRERHLDATQTRLALVNTMQPLDDAAGRLLRVPFAS